MVESEDHHFANLNKVMGLGINYQCPLISQKKTTQKRKEKKSNVNVIKPAWMEPVNLSKL